MPHPPTPPTALRAAPALPFPRTIVTGASSGIGRALALELVHHGIPVLAVARSAALVRGLLAGHLDIRIGKARAAWHLQRWAPWLLARMLRSA